MPYIDKSLRAIYDNEINIILQRLSVLNPQDAAGIFTYVIYRLLKYFNGKFWMRALGMGCLVCAIFEWYRRDISEYENEKIEQYGDVK